MTHWRVPGGGLGSLLGSPVTRPDSSARIQWEGWAGDRLLGGAVGRGHEVDVGGLGGDGEFGLEVVEQDDAGGAGGGQGELEEAGVFGHAGG